MPSAFKDCELPVYLLLHFTVVYSISQKECCFPLYANQRWRLPVSMLITAPTQQDLSAELPLFVFARVEESELKCGLEQGEKRLAFFFRSALFSSSSEKVTGNDILQHPFLILL